MKRKESVPRLQRKNDLSSRKSNTSTTRPSSPSPFKIQLDDSSELPIDNMRIRHKTRPLQGSAGRSVRWIAPRGRNRPELMRETFQLLHQVRSHPTPPKTLRYL